MVGPRGTVGTQYYTETVIKLQAPDPAFGSKIKKTGAATFTGLRSEEDGRVWKIDAITIPPTLHNN
jgi:hypothetical protein